MLSKGGKRSTLYSTDTCDSEADGRRELTHHSGREGRGGGDEGRRRILTKGQGGARQGLGKGRRVDGEKIGRD